MTFHRTLKSFFSGIAYTISILAIFPVNALENDQIYPEKPFRAEVQITVGGEITPAILYGKGAFMRLEMTANNNPVVQIVNIEKDETLMLIDVGGEKTAMRLKADNSFDSFGLSHTNLGAVAGKKEIAGFQCSLYKVQDSTICLTADNIALESITKSGTMRVNSLQIGDQNASLFEVPEGYKVVDADSMIEGVASTLFDSEGSVLGAMFNQSGQNPDSNVLSGIEKIIDAGDDEEAASNAALDAMLGMAGLPAGTISADDTTAGVLIESLDSQLNLSDADKAKAKAMMDENERLMDIMRRDGVAGLMREAGLSQSEIEEAERNQEKLEKMVQAHDDEKKGQIEAGNSAAPTNVATLDLEAELDTLNARAEALASDGDVSEADKVSIQKEAEEIFQKILGGTTEK